jgi:hypothetical protein
MRRVTALRNHHAIIWQIDTGTSGRPETACDLLKEPIMERYMEAHISLLMCDENYV